jgi:hypothetical protein
MEAVAGAVGLKGFDYEVVKEEGRRDDVVSVGEREETGQRSVVHFHGA